MRTKWKLPPTKYIVTGTALAVCATGAAEAASETLHHMKVAGPDGSQIEVAYTGDAAPRVEVVPASAQVEPSDAAEMREAAAQEAMADPFAQMQRMSLMMDAQMHAMMQRAALMQRQAATLQQRALQQAQMTTSVNGQEVQPGFTLAGTMPKGVHVTYYSASTDANGCTRSVSYSSDGSGAQPRMVQAASDSCGADQAGAKASERTIPVKAEAPSREPVKADSAHTV